MNVLHSSVQIIVVAMAYVACPGSSEINEGALYAW